MKLKSYFPAWKALTLVVVSSLMATEGLMASNLEHVNDQLIVKVKNSFKKNKSLKAKFHKMANVVDEMDLLAGEFMVLAPKHLTKAATANLKHQLAQLPEVEYVENNQVISLETTQTKSSINDPSFNVLWGLKNTGKNVPDTTGNPSSEVGVVGNDIDAEAAWDISKGSKKIKIAVVDTGIDYKHPDLAKNIWVNKEEAEGQEGVDDDNNGIIDDVHGANFVNAENPTGNSMDDHDHGTHCAGTIAAVHNTEGVAGVMSEATLVGVKFLSASGSGSLAGAIKGIDYATRLKVHVMSNSWGGGGFSQALLDVIEKAEKKGILFIAAAGNSAADTDKNDFYPANYKVNSLISVAATAAQDVLASFSNYGAKNVHVAAPGHRILSTTKGGKYKVFSGTSMATPHVSGVAGLILSANPKLTPAEVKSLLIKTSTEVESYNGKVVANGRVNAFAALKEATNK
jgi:thermitase